MFGLFKSDPTKKLQKEFEDLSEKAMYAQRKGDIELYSELTFKADEIYKKIEKIREEQQNTSK